MFFMTSIFSVWRALENIKLFNELKIFFWGEKSQKRQKEIDPSHSLIGMHFIIEDFGDDFLYILRNNARVEKILSFLIFFSLSLHSAYSILCSLHKHDVKKERRKEISIFSYLDTAKRNAHILFPS